MKKICSWCNLDLGTVSVESSYEDAVTHGICTECLNTFFGPRRVGLLDFIDGLDAAVVVVDAAGRVQSANKLAQGLLHKELPAIVGFQGGDVFECAYATLPGGCGNTIHCDGCTIRNTVMDTFRTERSHFKKPSCLTRGTLDNHQEVRFLISTEKINDIVLLKIDRL